MIYNPVLIRIGRKDYISFIEEVLETDQKTTYLLRGTLEDTHDLKSRNMGELKAFDRSLPRATVTIYKNKNGYDSI